MPGGRTAMPGWRTGPLGEHIEVIAGRTESAGGRRSVSGYDGCASTAATNGARVRVNGTGGRYQLAIRGRHAIGSAPAVRTGCDFGLDRRVGEAGGRAVVGTAACAAGSSLRPGMGTNGDDDDDEGNFDVHEAEARPDGGTLDHRHLRNRSVCRKEL